MATKSSAADLADTEAEVARAVRVDGDTRQAALLRALSPVGGHQYESACSMHETAPVDRDNLS